MSALRAAGSDKPVITIAQGLNSLKNIREAGSLYFKNAASAGLWLDTAANELNPEILLADLLNEQKAFAFSEIMEDMSQAGLSYAGSLDISNYLDNVITPKAFWTASIRWPGASFSGKRSRAYFTTPPTEATCSSNLPSPWTKPKPKRAFAAKN